MLNIQQGQRWNTRGGDVVTVTADRREFAVVSRWRWALSNGVIVDDEGRACLGNREDRHDLVSQVPRDPDAFRRTCDEGMDSMAGPL